MLSGKTPFTVIMPSVKPIEEINVWLGKKNTVGAYVKTDVYKTIPKARKKNLRVSVIYNGPIQAPIKKDDIIGKLKVTYKNELIDEFLFFNFISFGEH